MVRAEGLVIAALLLAAAAAVPAGAQEAGPGGPAAEVPAAVDKAAPERPKAVKPRPPGDAAAGPSRSVGARKPVVAAAEAVADDGAAVPDKPKAAKPAAGQRKPVVAAAAAGSAAIDKALEPARPAKARRKVDPTTTASIAPVPEPVAYRPSGELLNWYVERGNVTMPRGHRLVYCHGFECRLRTAIGFDAEDDRQIEAIFATRRGSAAEERDAIDHLVQWWENRAAPHLGGPPDIRGSEPGQANRPGQTDCLDEATNSTTILVYAQQRGLLRYHTVSRPESRGGFLYAHATAVYEEVGGKAWVVDSWMRDSGDPNDIMPLEEWLAKY